MGHEFAVQELVPDDWRRLQTLRLKSLVENPEAFGGDLAAEKLEDENAWRSKFSKLDYLVATANGLDIAIMSVQVLDGDHGATCWIGGCWSDPKFRGKGAIRAMFEYLDAHAVERGWRRQGLGVWTDNKGAISAYSAIGFVDAGFRQESERQPGRFYMHMVRDTLSK